MELLAAATTEAMMEAPIQEARNAGTGGTLRDMCFNRPGKGWAEDKINRLQGLRNGLFPSMEAELAISSRPHTQKNPFGLTICLEGGG